MRTERGVYVSPNRMGTGFFVVIVALIVAGSVWEAVDSFKTSARSGQIVADNAIMDARPSNGSRADNLAALRAIPERGYNTLAEVVSETMDVREITIGAFSPDRVAISDRDDARGREHWAVTIPLEFVAHDGAHYRATAYMEAYQLNLAMECPTERVDDFCWQDVTVKLVEQ